MKISYTWLQSYFEEKLPEPEKLGDVLTFAGFEVESCDKLETGDTVLDVKVLADRACYALSHRGIAREVSAMLRVPLVARKSPAILETDIPDADIGIDEPKLCTKFVARRVENIQVCPSPAWLKERLEAIGQRSINSIVDITNFVMFDIGRPTHAFDADKIKGTLTVRSATKGEKVVTLDNKEIELTNGELVMADDEGPVGLAGIKGGKRTEVDAETKNIILEAANWNPSYIRLTATATGVKTEASKRFENKISPSLGEEGIDALVGLISDLASTPETKIGKKIVISHEKDTPRTLSVDAARISRKLGITLSEEDVVGSLARLNLPCEKKDDVLVVTVPPERFDLTIPEDLAEEVGRMIGYEKIEPALPLAVLSDTRIDKAFYTEWKIRALLFREGFSEVMTSSFSSTGDQEIEKPLAKDKGFARPSLREGFAKSLSANILLIPLLDVAIVKQFEIGTVFTEKGEYTALALGVGGDKKKVKGVLEGIRSALSRELGAPLEGEEKDNVFECSLASGIENLPGPKAWDIVLPPEEHNTFTAFSLYPFIVRDVALFVSADTDPEEVASVIRDTAGQFVVRGPSLFDRFEKDGKKSLAFRLVFQALDRTLTDDEVNAVMKTVYDAIVQKGWEIR